MALDLEGTAKQIALPTDAAWYDATTNAIKVSLAAAAMSGGSGVGSLTANAYGELLTAHPTMEPRLSDLLRTLISEVRALRRVVCAATAQVYLGPADPLDLN